MRDSYTRLRELVVARFRGHRRAETVLDDYLEDPETWRTPLEVFLRETGALSDPAVLETAQQLMSLLDPSGATRGQYAVNIHNSSGLQLNHQGGNVQVNNFKG